MENGKWKMEPLSVNGFRSFSIFHLPFSICHLGSESREARFYCRDHCVDSLYLGNEPPEHVGQQGLRAIRQGELRMIVNLDHDSIGARRNRRSRKRKYFVSLACSM